MSPLDSSESTIRQGQEQGEGSRPAFPTETEIYILPDGRIVVADMPQELAPLLARLGMVEPCEVPPELDTTAA